MAGPLGLRRRGWNRAAGPSSHTSLLVLTVWSRTPTEVGRPPQVRALPAVSCAPAPCPPSWGKPLPCWCWDLTEPEMGASPNPITDFIVTSLLLQAWICSSDALSPPTAGDSRA